MKYILALILLSQVSMAQSKKSKKEEWQTFKSNLGFQFEYPKCFKISIESVDSGNVLLDSPHITLRPSRDCGSSDLTLFFAVQYWVDPGDESTEKLFNKSFEFYKKGMKLPPLAIKKRKNSNAFSYLFLEKLNDNNLRLRGALYCLKDKKRLTISGPEINEYNLKYKLMKSEAKKGDLYVPPPFDRIIESVKCP